MICVQVNVPILFDEVIASIILYICMSVCVCETCYEMLQIKCIIAGRQCNY